MIGKLLGHAKMASTARYASVAMVRCLEAAERVGVLIERAIEPNVVTNQIDSPSLSLDLVTAKHDG